MTNDANKEIAALREEVAALKAALSGKEDKPPPKKEFVEQPYQRYDPTAGMCMPPSALQAMVAAEPRGFMSGVVRDNRAPNSPSTIPRREQATGNVSAPSSTPGWVAPTQLSNPPGTNWVDAIAIADDVRQRAELKRKLGG
jgi:hypothetical protein